MVAGSPTGDVPALVTIRRLLIATWFAGIVGTGAELLLLGHFETWIQAVPLVLLGVGFVAVLWQLAAPRAASVRALQAVAILFLGAGVFGIGFHYDGNAALAVEKAPPGSGRGVAREALTGPSPVLAPGSMALLGFVGLAYTYRHPQLGNHPWFPEEEVE
jgi:hypothetical protein